ncbi:retropepsin-like aspartic protease [Peribacillus cavernae]|nr:retropepsin-like aspartic protease [Peribacillus cavernae]MDQ0220664.1 hypothetical protein [Peribacillus cavernae]
MINLSEVHGLPFVEATVIFRGKSIQLNRILIDTGSAGTIFNVNSMEKIGVKPEANDVTHTIYGVGGAEFVYTKQMDQIYLSQDISTSNFLIELGSMDYGLEIDGIIGYDFMRKTGIVIDLNKMNIHI